MESVKISRDGTTVVDLDNNWKPMGTCPVGYKVLLQTSHGVATLGKWHGPDIEPDVFVGWFPLPSNPKD